MHYLKFISFCLIVSLSAHTLVAQTFPETAEIFPELESKKYDQEDLVLANNNFAFEMYAQIKEQNKNIVFSPYSLSSAFGMVYLGAQGMTQSQIARVLHFSSNKSEVSHSFKGLNQLFSIKHLDREDLTLNISNSLWIQQGITLLPSFLNSITNEYHGDIKQVDFFSKLESARLEINKWVSDKTQGKITDLIARNALSKAARMVLVSTIYMKGRWAYPFDQSFTRQTPFFPFPSTTLTVPMMTTTAHFSFLREKEFSLLELPYDSKNLEAKISMLIILPHETYGLPLLEPQLNAHKLKEWMAALEKQKVVVTIPKFKMTNSFDLTEVMKKLGIDAAFSDQADFSGINGAKDIKLSKVLQKAFITVDEKGTEAGAATAIIGVAKAFDPQSPEIFLADHPFMYLIVDKISGAILFMGKVSDPSTDM